MFVFLKFLERFKLTTKLVIGFSVGIVITVLVGLNALASLGQVQDQMETMYEKDLQGISEIKDANLNLIYMSRAMRHMLIAQDDATRDAALASIKRSREKLMIGLAESRKRIFRPEIIARYDQLQRDLPKALEAIEQAIGMIQRDKSNPSAAAQFITSKNFSTIIAEADNGMHELSELTEKAAEATLQRAREEASEARRTAIYLLVLGIALAGILGATIGLSIKRPSERLTRAIEELADGEVDAPIPHTEYPNEVGVMARSLAVLQGIYRQSNAQHWVKSHASEISSALQQCEDLRSLAQTSVSKLAKAVGAGHGAFYVLEADGSFQLQASFGYRERKHVSSRFAIGEGLIGQCAMEKAAITLRTPKDYIQISSGLGEGPPAAISVMPIILGERVLGVLEMASFQVFTEREQALMDALLPSLATSIEILDRNVKTKELLAATQEQAERMEKQAAQLEEQTVEMEAQQAELLETENWFRSIIDASPDGLLVVDSGGRILLSNPAADALFGFAPGELSNTDVDLLLPETLRGGHGEKRARFMAEERSRKMADGVDLTGRRKDGSAFSIRVSLALLPPRGGRGKCVSVTIRPARNSERKDVP
jgi:PAS domain S-box-containing protein